MIKFSLFFIFTVIFVGYFYINMSFNISSDFGWGNSKVVQPNLATKTALLINVIEINTPTVNLKQEVLPSFQLSTWTPIPTELPDIANKINGVLHSQNCLFPCYLNITPGITKPNQAQTIMENLGKKTILSQLLEKMVQYPMNIISKLVIPQILIYHIL